MAKKKGDFNDGDIVEVKKDSTHAKEGEVGKIVYMYQSGSVEVEFEEERIVMLLPDEIKLHDGTVRNIGTDPIQQRDSDKDPIPQSVGPEGLQDNGWTDDTGPK